MEYEVNGIDRKTGHTRKFYVSAQTLDEVKKHAIDSGYLIKSARPVTKLTLEQQLILESSKNRQAKKIRNFIIVTTVIITSLSIPVLMILSFQKDKKEFANISNNNNNKYAYPQNEVEAFISYAQDHGGIYSIDRSLHIVRVNQQFWDMLDYNGKIKFVTICSQWMKVNSNAELATIKNNVNDEVLAKDGVFGISIYR